MKYLLTAVLFVLAALCLSGLLMTSYNPGVPMVVERTVTETVYVGSNFEKLVWLAVLALAAGVGGFFTLICMILTEKDLQADEIRYRGGR